MLNWEQLVISALVGAAIGYITNWIAIKMLFRPVAAKYILGVRVPFTPGVIPKEKGRLARSIGEAVSKHLLSPEFISGQLLSPGAEEKVRLFIREKIGDIEGKTVGEVLDEAGIDSRAREKWLKKVDNRLLMSAQDQRLQILLAELAAAVVMDLLDRRPGDLAGTEEFASLKNSLEKGIVSFLSQAENREFIKQFLAERVERLCASTLTVRDYIPGPLLERILEYAGSQGARIVNVVDDYLNSPETKELLVKRVENFFDRSPVRRLMGNILGKFVGSPGQVADKIVEEVANFFAEPDNRKLLAQKMEVLLDDILDLRLCDLAARLDVQTRRKTVLEVGDWLSDRLCSGEVVSGFLAMAGKALAGAGITWGQLLGINDRERAKQKFEDYFKQFIERLTSIPEFKTLLNKFVHNLVSWLLNTRTSDLIPYLSSGKISELEEKMLGYYRNFVNSYLAGILDFVNFRQLIARRVDDLDVLQVEELVLGIMRRELVAITWLGAILGAVIGIIMVLGSGFTL